MSTIAITGAARGIALELVKAYQAEGARVYAFCRNMESADALKALAAKSDGLVTVHSMDVASDESVRAGVKAIGDANIDILFNVAGVLGSVPPELEVGSSDWAMWQASSACPCTTGTGRGPQPSSAGANCSAQPMAKVGTMSRLKAVA